MLRNKNVTIQTLLKSRCLVSVPVVNPDTYDLNVKNHISSRKYGDSRKNQRPTCSSSTSTASSGNLRKNRHRSSSGSCRDPGVDLNRNYPTCFGHDSKGSSQKPGAEDYEGAYAFSEPETQVVKKVVESHHFRVGINFHSYGKYIYNIITIHLFVLFTFICFYCCFFVVIYNHFYFIFYSLNRLVAIPFACKSMGATLPTSKDEELLQYISSNIAKMAGYSYMRPWQDKTLYPVNGETSDWMYVAHKIIAMSIEVYL